MVPGGAQKSSGGWCEGSNPPQGVPGDHSWLTLGGSMTWWADSTMEHACATLQRTEPKRIPKLLVLNITMNLVSKREFPFFSKVDSTAILGGFRSLTYKLYGVFRHMFLPYPGRVWPNICKFPKADRGQGVANLL